MEMYLRVQGTLFFVFAGQATDSLTSRKATYLDVVCHTHVRFDSLIASILK